VFAATLDSFTQFPKPVILGLDLRDTEEKDYFSTACKKAKKHNPHFAIHPHI
jgi:hypothetical protein